MHSMMEASSTFAQLLNIFWLRPETAMWREIDIQAMKSFKFESPSLDLGCGDGLFSFIRAAGKFQGSFDAFQVMGNLESFFENADVFDAGGASVVPHVLKLPEYKIDIGFDHKENLLRKAEPLKLYIELKLGDANATLPFSDGYFESIFSNIIYWLDDPQKALKEIARVLAPEGKVCLMLPNYTLPEFSFYNQYFVKTGLEEFEFLTKIDRGRFGDNIRQAKSGAEWGKMFDEANLKKVSHTTHLSKTAIQIWDIGMRPLFPVLLKMVKLIDSENLGTIKEEWVSIFSEFLEPIVRMDTALGQGEEPAFHCYVLEK